MLGGDFVDHQQDIGDKYKHYMGAELTTPVSIGNRYKLEQHRALWSAKIITTLFQQTGENIDW